MSFLRKLFRKETEKIEDIILYGQFDDFVKKVEDEKLDLNSLLDDYLPYIIKSEDSQILEYFLNKNIKLPQNIDGEPLITYAITNRSHNSILGNLLEQNVKYENALSLTPFEIALQKDSWFPVFDLLIEKKSIHNSLGKLPITHQIVENIHMEACKKIYLLRKLVDICGMDLNQKVPGEQPLLIKAKKLNDNKLLTELLKLGADVRDLPFDLNKKFSPSKIKELSPYLALYQPKEATTHYLKYLEFDDFKDLLEKIEDASSIYAVISISSNRFLDIDEKIILTKLALKKGADINEKPKEKEVLNALHQYALTHEVPQKFDYVDFLIESGIKLEREDFSILYSFIEKNEIRVVECLLKKGANVNFKTKFDKNAISFINLNEYYKSENEILVMVKILLRYSLDVNQTQTTNNKTETIFEYLASRGFNSVTKFIYNNVKNVQISKEMEKLFK